MFKPHTQSRDRGPARDGMAVLVVGAREASAQCSAV